MMIETVLDARATIGEVTDLGGGREGTLLDRREGTAFTAICRRAAQHGHGR